MNKPILVKNQSEWNRLAPVLEALGYVWFKSNQKPTQVDIWNRWMMSFCIIIKGNKISCTANISNSQTVEEYLQANTLKANELQKVDDINVADLEHPIKGVNTDINGKPIPSAQQVHWSNEPIFNMSIYKSTDYKEMEIENKRLKAIETKYETLLQGVKDAKAEMNRVKKFQNYDYHSGFNEAISILTDKTNVL
jgi:hypothetical protein